MIKKFLVIILVLCIIFMVGSIVFAGGDCEEETPTPSIDATEIPTPSVDSSTPTPSEETTATPSEETTPETSATSEVSNSPENTPGQETAQTSVNPTSTKTGSTLPKTGESSSVLIYVGIVLLLAGLSISIIFRKKLFN